MLSSHGRYDYTPITRRSTARWPNGAGLAVYVALGLEEYIFGEGLTENIISGVPHPDLTNTSWRDYGNRVGAFRLLEQCRAIGIPLSILLNTEVYDHAPELVAACRDAGCAMIAHGQTNSHTLAGRGESDERAYLSLVRERMLNAGDKASGWSSPWLVHTAQTIDLLQETGYRYVLDLGLDDRAVWLRTRTGRLLHIPYGLELNDSSTAVGRLASGRAFAEMITDQFDELLAASDQQPLIMSVVIHSFISGQPFRLRPLMAALRHIAAHAGSIWLTTPDAIHASIVANPDLAV
jgi:hypothetical protein